MSAPAPAPVVQPGGTDEPMKAHLVCAWCHPVPALGITAVCGETLLGIVTTEDLKCPGCLEMQHQPWPCGH